MPGERHTFVFADLAGFTALTEAHGDLAAADLVAEFARKVGRWLPEFGGGDAKTVGDAMMLRLSDPSGAVELGLAIVERTADTPDFPEVRVGMNSGPAVRRGGDWFGGAVNVAARIASEARGCDVLLSAATRDAATGLRAVEFESLGSRRLRNVSVPMEIYKATRAGTTRGRLQVDPVCRMALRPDQPGPVIEHEGMQLRFCSEECARTFAAAPDRYAVDRETKGGT